MKLTRAVRKAAVQSEGIRSMKVSNGLNDLPVLSEVEGNPLNRGGR